MIQDQMMGMIDGILSGQIITTEKYPKWWWFSKGNPLISGKSRLVKLL